MAGGRLKSKVAKKVDNLAILTPFGMLDIDAKMKNMSADSKSTRSDSDYDSGSSSGYHSVKHPEELMEEELEIPEEFDDAIDLGDDDFDDDIVTSEDEADQDVETALQGEFAMDLFIDPLNPMFKDPHPTLKSKQKKISKEEEELKKKRAEQRAEEIRELKQKRKLERQRQKRIKMKEALEKKLDKLKSQTEVMNSKNRALNIRMKNAKIRENNYKIRVARYHDNILETYEREAQRGRAIVNSIKNMRMELGEIQKERMEILLSKMEPLIIKGGPSQKTTYKLHARRLHFEIFGLTQRIRIIHLRVESEAIRRRAIEFEVKQLRHRVYDQHAKIAIMTKGLPASKIALMELEEHKKRFKDLCKKYKIYVEPVENDLPEYFPPISRSEAERLKELNIDPCHKEFVKPQEFETLI